MKEMVKRSAKTQPSAEKPERVDAEPVENSQITASGKVEQTPEEKKRAYRESLTRTLTATAFGIISGFVCYYLLEAAVGMFWPGVLIVLMTLTYYTQRRLVFPAFKMNMAALNWKDWFGIQFLVLFYCLVTWTILLNVLS